MLTAKEKVRIMTTAEVRQDFKKYRYVVPAVQFFPGTKHSSTGTAILSRSKLTVGL